MNRKRGSSRAGRAGVRHQRGAAILLAVLIVALLTTVASAMLWLQTRAVQVEAAERARAQAGWVLTGALDWARLILREDQRSSNNTGPVDSLDEPWAQKLEEARLSTFLAADKDNTLDGGPEAFISGSITDAQARFNLRGLVDGAGKAVPAQAQGLQRLADLVGAPGDTASRIAETLGAALGGPEGVIAAANSNVANTANTGTSTAPLRPQRLSDLAWFGIDRATLARLAPYVELLPLPTAVNVNTAPREVLVAAIDDLDLGSAERLVQTRSRKPFRSVAEVQAQLPATAKPPDPNRLAVASSWFEVSGRLRLEGRVLEERSLVQREPDRVTVRRRERVSYEVAAPGS